MDLVARLCRCLPALAPEDARQYVAEAECALGADAPGEALFVAALERARQDGYADPVVIGQDREDSDGHLRSWTETVSDGGVGVLAVWVRLGESGERPRRRPMAASRVRRAVARLLAQASPAEWAVLWARWGRLLAGLAPATLREAARAGGVALGTAWNIEARAKRTVERLAARPAPKPRQLGFGWMPPDSPVAPPDPPLPDEPRESRGQLELPLELPW